MTVQVALDHVPPLTDTQRNSIRDFYAANPKTGYKRALAHIGIKATKAAAEAAIRGDDELHDIRETTLGVTPSDALSAIGQILADPDHKDRLRAAEAALKLLYGFGEKTQLELTGAGGGPLQTEDRSASLGDVAQVLVAVGAFAQLSGGAARGELPAAPDILAEPSEG